jgi:hypothetical protein
MIRAQGQDINLKPCAISALYMTVRVLACALWVNDGRVLLQEDGEKFLLPRVEVSDDETNEMALTSFFQRMNWMIAVGGLRYLVEEIKDNIKILHLVFDVTVMKQGNTNGIFKFVPVAQLNGLKAEPTILFGKIQADLKGSRPSGCVTLVSW